MGAIRKAFISPHPPLVVHEVGRGEERKAAATVEALERLAREVAKIKPSTIIVTTPHAPVFQDYVFINHKDVLSGDFRRFGAPEVKLRIENNLELAEEITVIANSQGIPCGGLDDTIIRRYRISEELDHGAMVPLYYINREYSGFRLVHIAIAALPFKELYRFGRCIATAVEQSGEEAVFLASGDLSHRLSPDGPYGFNECGPEFDGRLVEYLKIPDREAILGFDEGFLEEAGECGLRSFIMMFGALDEFEIRPEVYSYEGPLGVGYAVAEFTPVSRIEGETLLDRLDRREIEEMSMIRSNEDPYTALARKSLEMYVLNGTVIDVPEVLPEEMRSGKAGVFVSIKKHGRLRGCIGTIMPARENIASEIIHNAISAGVHDPRFPPVTEDELDDLVYSVDVLGKPEPINSIEELDVRRYGVIVRAGMRSGLLLPDLEGIDTPQQQVAIALQKAGIRPDEKYTMERFEVVRHK
ncbi:MAG TPA: AmmeMemoRadiSam system protein A [Clostridiales bacterium]|nr:AmmeMemoRadiSam system protein A [Clostridiales bacterium]